KSGRRIRAQSRSQDGSRLAYQTGYLPESRTVNTSVWKIEVRMVEEIKEPRTNCKTGSFPFGNLETFSNVKVGGFRAPDRRCRSSMTRIPLSIHFDCRSPARSVRGRTGQAGRGHCRGSDPSPQAPTNCATQNTPGCES